MSINPWQINDTKWFWLCSHIQPIVDAFEYVQQFQPWQVSKTSSIPLCLPEQKLNTPSVLRPRSFTWVSIESRLTGTPIPRGCTSSSPSLPPVLVSTNFGTQSHIISYPCLPANKIYSSIKSVHVNSTKWFYNNPWLTPLNIMVVRW